MNAAKIRCVVASLFLVLTACPAADLPDGNDADAGPGDEGEGEGEETICDSGDCLCYPEPFDDLYDATGRPIYENCHFGPQMLKLCEGDECADTDAEQDALDRIMSIAVERDYPATMDLRYLYVDDVDVNAEFLIVIDWYQFRLHIVAPMSGGVVNLEALRAEMPLWIPPTVPPIEAVWSAVQVCDEDAKPYFCLMSNGVVSVEFVGECGVGRIFLWDDDVVGTGMSDPECEPSDLPCCGPEYD
jgi:hypothetical protein